MQPSVVTEQKESKLYSVYPIHEASLMSGVFMELLKFILRTCGIAWTMSKGSVGVQNMQSIWSLQGIS